MSILDEFEDYYNTLDMYLRRIGGYPENKSAIYDYEFVIDPHRSAQLGTIRRFRNSFSGHGNRVGGEMPTPPRSYITFLDEEIKYIQENEDEVAMKMRKRRESDGDYGGRGQYNDRGKTSSGGSNRKTVSTSPRPPKKEAPKRVTPPKEEAPKKPTAPTYNDDVKRTTPPPTPTPPPPPKKEEPKIELIDGVGPNGIYKDEANNFIAGVIFSGGRGRFIKKGLLKQENMIDFWVEFKFKGACKAAGACIYTTTGAQTVRIKEGMNIFEMNALLFKDGVVKMQVLFEYRISATQTKRGSITIAKRF